MNDKISALLDGDLDVHSSKVVLDSMRNQPGLRASWDEYCLIGDLLRAERSGSVDFTARVMAGLEAEPTVLAPVRKPDGNDWGWVRSLLPIAASVMGVAVVGWVALSVTAQPQGSITLADTGNIVRVQSVVPAQAVVRAQPLDPRLEYVLMHQATTGGGPLSGAMQYVRTVSDTQGDLPR